MSDKKKEKTPHVIKNEFRDAFLEVLRNEIRDVLADEMPELFEKNMKAYVEWEVAKYIKSSILTKKGALRERLNDMIVRVAERHTKEEIRKTTSLGRRIEKLEND